MGTSYLSDNTLKTMVSLLFGGLPFHIHNCMCFEGCDIFIFKKPFYLFLSWLYFIVVIFEKSLPNLRS